MMRTPPGFKVLVGASLMPGRTLNPDLQSKFYLPKMQKWGQVWGWRLAVSIKGRQRPF